EPACAATFLSAYDLAVTEADTLFSPAKLIKCQMKISLAFDCRLYLGNRTLLACLFAACSQVVLYSFGCSNSLAWCLEASALTRFTCSRWGGHLTLDACALGAGASGAGASASGAGALWCWRLWCWRLCAGAWCERSGALAPSVLAPLVLAPLVALLRASLKRWTFLATIVRHLIRLCVDRVVDSLAWTAGSPLWKLVAAESRPRYSPLNASVLYHVIACGLFARGLGRLNRRPPVQSDSRTSWPLIAGVANLTGSSSTVAAGGQATDTLFRTVPLDNRGMLAILSSFTMPCSPPKRAIISDRCGSGCFLSVDGDVQAITPAITAAAPPKLLGKRQATSHHIGMELSPKLQPNGGTMLAAADEDKKPIQRQWSCLKKPRQHDEEQTLVPVPSALLSNGLLASQSKSTKIGASDRFNLDRKESAVIFFCTAIRL
uniref:WD_REPEATS_REGION domain-containing protein n=1 Tax=Macrostomum lignano TaxID=282301 RepID=A0A1I8FEY2_9PLAT